jgi:hypothetical protein
VRRRNGIPSIEQKHGIWLGNSKVPATKKLDVPGTPVEMTCSGLTPLYVPGNDFGGNLTNDAAIHMRQNVRIFAVRIQRSNLL